MNIKQYHLKLLDLQGSRRSYIKQMEKWEGELEQKTALCEIMGEARELVKKVGAQTQKQLTIRLGDLVTQCLTDVMGEGYEFKMTIQERGGTSHFDMFIVEEGEPYDPMDAKGGTVVDIITFALRVACLMLDKKAAKVLVMDEPFRFVSKDLQAKAAVLLERVFERLGFQMVVITHEPAIIEGVGSDKTRVFEITQNASGTCLGLD